MANDYTSSTDAFAILGVGEANYSTSDYPAMATFITAASRLIDAEMGRWAGFFYPTTDTVTKYYDGSGESEQNIGEWATLTTVSVSEDGSVQSSDYTSLASTDYFEWPYNHTADAGPIKKIILDTLNSTVLYRFSPYRKSVLITGIPGYSLTPPDIVVRACTRQAIMWFMSAKQGYQETGASATIGGMTFTTEKLDSSIKEMLWPLILELSA